MKATEVGVWAVVLTGGDGRRLPPLTSRPTGDGRPKQFCAIGCDLGDARRVVAMLRRTGQPVPWLAERTPPREAEILVETRTVAS